MCRGQGAGTETCGLDHRVERGCPFGAEGGSGGRVVQHFTRGVGVETGRVGESFAEGARLPPVGVEFQGGKARADLEHGGRRLGIGEERGGCVLGLVEVGPRRRCLGGAAVGAQELGDEDLPGLRGLGGVDQVAGLFEHEVSKAGISMGITTALGFLGSAFTFGASDAGAATLDGAEAAALLGSVDGVMDAALADYAAEGMAELETVLASAAKNVPEVEAVDAETQEVTQALDREMAEAEARGGGSGKGGGGGGDRTPPEEEEPPEEEPEKPSKGRTAQENGQKYEDRLVEKLGGRGGFRTGGRQLDGEFEEDGVEYWYEAKSGKALQRLLNDEDEMHDFKSTLGQERQLARANGKEFLLISENPIPEELVKWLTKKGYVWRIMPIG